MTSIKGAVDSIQRLGDGLLLGGWACFDDEGVRTSVEIVELDGLGGRVTWHSRPDFGSENEFGFHLHIDGAAARTALRLGEIRCTARRGDHVVRLGVWDRLAPRIEELAAEDMIQRLSPEVRSRVTARLVGELAATTYPVDASTLPAHGLLTPGLVSFDGSTVVGPRGDLFLKGGSNAVEHLYSESADTRAAPRWSELVQRRVDACAERGIAFRQIVIPEKQTILREAFPGAVAGPTRLLGALEPLLSACPSYVSMLDRLERLHRVEGLPPFRKVDSHYSYFGARCTVEALLDHLGMRVQLPEPELEVRLVGGDLGSKFGVGSFVEHALLPPDGWRPGSCEPERSGHWLPPTGHTGTRITWTSTAPVIDARVMAFGNSFFERGGAPTGLSWWFARLFREFTFVWSPAIDFAQVDNCRPDVVIAQTVERFLPSVPST